MVRKVLLYALPLYLYVLEVLLKAMAAVKDESVLGPTLAGAGIGFLLPLTELKRVQVGGQTGSYLERQDVVVYKPTDKNLVDFVWFAILASLLGWVYALFLTFKPTHIWWLVSLPLIGGAIFALSGVRCEIKERL